MPARGWTKLKAGDVLGKLTLKSATTRDGSTFWLCSCECGIVKEVRAGALARKSRATVTCGDREKHPHPSITHGMAGSKEHTAWKAMKARCRENNPQGAEYYRDQGVRVFDGWENDFPAFLAHIGPMPDGHRIGVDRFPDRDGNYEPGNVRWATPGQNNKNRRKRRFYRRPNK